MTKRELAQRLSSLGWMCSINTDSVTAIRIFGKKTLTIKFCESPRGGDYVIKHPSYSFVSVVSHFKSAQDNVRLCLNKSYLIKIVKEFKKEGVWPVVLNHNFLIVNDLNIKSDKKELKKLLESLL
jgi:hypothetical protein